MSQISFLNCNIEDREKFFISFYKKAFPEVARYISKMGGTFDEAKDVFQDALIIYYEKSVNDTLTVKSSDQAYILGVAKYLWFKKHKGNNQHTSLDGLNISINEDDGENLSDRKLMHFLQTAGKRCMELLRAFYYDQLSLSETADQFGFSGVRSATVQKYKCLEKVRETVKQKSLTYEDFLE